MRFYDGVVSLRFVRLVVTVGAVAVLLSSCGSANDYSSVKAMFLGVNQGLSCFVPTEEFLRKAYADCYPPTDELSSARLEAGACVTVRLPEHNRYPDLKARFVKLDSGCDIAPDELACWKTELIERPQRSKVCSAKS
jgi:hypothetical protein